MRDDKRFAKLIERISNEQGRKLKLDEAIKLCEDEDTHRTGVFSEAVTSPTLMLGQSSDGVSVDKKSNFKWIALAAGASLVLIGAIAFALIDSNSSSIQQANTNQSNGNSIVSLQPKADKRYSEMSEKEKQQFVSTEADKILQIIKSGQESEITLQGKAAIKYYVDIYAKRSNFEKNDSCGSKTFFQSDLTSVLKRGAKIAPDITAGFKEREIPAQVGIYMAMNESEFCPCLQNPTGPLGIYQFTADSGNFVRFENG